MDEENAEVDKADQLAEEEQNQLLQRLRELEVEEEESYKKQGEAEIDFNI